MSEIPIDIVGFDLDGTLLDTHGDLGQAVNHALKSAGRESVPISVIRGLVGGGSGQMLGRALELTGGRVPDDEFKAIHGELLTYYEANIAVHSGLFPGGQDMLDALSDQGIKLAVVTNKLEKYARRLLEELDLARRFEVILGGDSLGKGRAKPSPDLIHEMIDRLGGGRAAYIGDTSFDTGAAEAAGVPCVAVTFGYCDVPIAELRAAAVIDHFDQLIPVLRRL